MSLLCKAFGVALAHGTNQCSYKYSNIVIIAIATTSKYLETLSLPKYNRGRHSVRAV